MSDAKFFQHAIYHCGNCGYVVWSKVLPGSAKIEIQCTNRGCLHRDKRFLVNAPEVTAIEIQPVEELAK